MLSNLKQGPEFQFLLSWALFSYSSLYTEKLMKILECSPDIVLRVLRSTWLLRVSVYLTPYMVIHTKQLFIQWLTHNKHLIHIATFIYLF